MTFNGWTNETKFEAECRALNLDPRQVAFARNFGRDMIAEAKQEIACNDNGTGRNCTCGFCTGAVTTDTNDYEPLIF